MLDLQSFDQLSPDALLDALESVGLQVESGLMALNSYENRVYRFKTAEQGWLVAKFYRPERWSNAQIVEELSFCRELACHDLPVVAPLELAGRLLHEFDCFRFCLMPSVGGRAFTPETDDEFERLGRLLGRLHLASQSLPFQHRLPLSPERLGAQSLAYLKTYLGAEPQAQAYLTTAERLVEACQQLWQSQRPALLSLHADCHLGNLLIRDEQLSLLDFDDCATGPAIQDLWMLLHGSEAERREQLHALLAGYEDFNEFDWRELALIELLRSLRLIHYSAWLARRWHEPTFSRSFPWFGRPDYWPQQQQLLQQQLLLLEA